MSDKVKILGAALLCVTLGSEALTLGRVRGAAWVGKPLDVAVQVQLDGGDDAAALCFEADVFHADTRQDASRVRVLVEPTANAQTFNVRILSSSPVDEPVLTIYLRTGCGQKTTRRYVLLADMPSEAATPHVPVVPSLPLAAPVAVLPPAPTAWSSANAAPAAAQPKAVRVAKPAVTKAVAPARKPAQPGEVKKKPERPSGQSLLKLNPLELSPAPAAKVVTTEPVKVEEPSEDALRQQQRMQVLEEAVKTGQLLALKNEANLADLKARLQQAESERFPAGVFYSVVALLLASLGALAFLWNRQRRLAENNHDWWSGVASTQAHPDMALAPVVLAPAAPEQPKQAVSQPVPAAAKSTAPVVAAAAEVDVDLMDMSDSTFGAFIHEGGEHAHQPRPQIPVASLKPHQVSNFNSEVMLDLRQQAEFFVSLGESDRAIRILKQQIDESDEANPFFYLDLLEIFHASHLTADYQQLREKFQRVFRGNVPEFAHFKHEGKGLESYAELLAHLCALWSSPAVLAEIDACIFHSADDSHGPVYELAAFRDLLLLQAVAHSIWGAPAEALAPQRASPSILAPLPAAAIEAPTPPAPVPLQLTAAPAPFLLDLDLDLADPSPDTVAPSLEAGLDFELPNLPTEAPVAKPNASSQHGALIDFDLTKAP